MTEAEIERYLINAYYGVDGNIWASEQLHNLMDLLEILDTGSFEPEDLTPEVLAALARTTSIERGRERYNAIRGGDLSRRVKKWWLQHAENCTGAVPRFPGGDPR